MMQGITGRVLQAVIVRVTRKLEACSAELNDLDAKLGDGDMGTTLATISRALRPEMESLPDDIGGSLSRVVRVIGRTSGSSLSAVMMTGLHRAAKATKDQTEVPWSELALLIELGLDAMQERGGAKLGDKSVLDGLAAIAAAIAKEADHTVYASVAEAAVAHAIAEYRDKPSRIGRARLAGDRSIGQDDPGMVALKRIIEAIRSTDDDAIAGNPSFPAPPLKTAAGRP
jgi:dihydroxyacetone kinase